MQVDIIVMVEKTNQSVMDWQLRVDRHRKLCAVYPNGSDQSPEKAWKDLTLKIHSLTLKKGKHAPLEVFLYLSDGLNNSIGDYGSLEDIVVDARDRVGGGKLYVVWDRLTETAFVDNFSERLKPYKKANKILLAECFRALLQKGVTDVIEIEPQEWAQGFDKKETLLRGYAAMSERRQQSLTAVTIEGGCGYVLRNEAWLLENLLAELIRESDRPSPYPNHVVVVDRPISYASGGPKALLDKFRRINRAQRGLVAATPEGDSISLSQECGKATPPLRLVKFNGIFEIMYALLQLNR